MGLEWKDKKIQKDDHNMNHFTHGSTMRASSGKMCPRSSRKIRMRRHVLDLNHTRFGHPAASSSRKRWKGLRRGSAEGVIVIVSEEVVEPLLIVSHDTTVANDAI